MTHITQRLGDRAVVIGGSMGGLLAARVLADFYAEVTILERDALPGAPSPRKGVPQGRHAHALLGKGQQILEELFPGLTAELVSQGALRGYGRFFSGGVYHHRVRLGAGGLYASRPLIEHEVRRRVLALPNVAIRQGYDVRGLAYDAVRAAVTGVQCVGRNGGAAEVMLPADLAVDASGRGSHCAAWLAALGYPKPEVEVVEVGMGYATRFYRREPDHLDGDLVLNVAPIPSNQRACGMLAQEGERWIVTLAGYFGDHPPTDDAGFLAFAKALPCPDIHTLIRTATPLSEPVAFRFPSNQRRRFERLKRFPGGLLVIGDAICSFTPIYGQGMTVAAIEATVLQRCLSAGLPGLAQRYFAGVSRAIDIPWSITVGNDLSLADPPVRRPPLARFLTWYMGKLHIAAQNDPVLAAAFLKVASLMEAPPSLLQPRLALRVLRGNLRRRSTSAAPAALPAAAEG